MNSSTSHRMGTDILVGLVGSRLCHDLISPLGAIGNGVELLDMTGPPGLRDSPEMSLINDSLRAARRRLQVFRIAFGDSSEDQRISEPDIRKLLDDLQGDSRIRIEMSKTADQSRVELRLLVLALMCLLDSMPWGGRILVARSDNRWRLVAEADRMKTDTGMWEWLDGAKSPPQPRPAEVQFTLLAYMLEDMARSARVNLDTGGAELLI